MTTIPHNVRHAIRGVRLALDDRQPSDRLVLRAGTVATVTAGASADGLAAVTVAVGGDLIPSAYYGSAPTVGAVVHVLFCNGSPVIIGTVHGFPAF